MSEVAKTDDGIPSMGLNLRREGSRFWFIDHTGNRRDIAADDVERIRDELTKQLHAAKHWKERGE